MAEIETPSLMEDTIEEILLRLPADDPESLLHAALVCKSWCRLVCSPAFNRRFREFHDRTSPPVLGFFYRIRKPFDDSFVPADTYFMPLTSFRRLPHVFMPNWGAVDARQGRVLFYDVNDMTTPDWVEHLHLIVWNPMTGEAAKLPVVPMDGPMMTWSAALICDDNVAADRGGLGAFRVAVVAYIQRSNSAWSNSGCVYSSEQHAWSTPVYKQLPGVPQLMARHALIGKSILYFPCIWGHRFMVEYDIFKQELSFIHRLYAGSHITLMTSMDGGLGFAVVPSYTRLHTCSRKVGSNGVARWYQEREFILDKLIPFSALNNYRTRVVAVENDLSVVFIITHSGIFVIDLKVGRVRKICEHPDDRNIVHIVPYASFCTPAVPSSFLDDQGLGDQEELVNQFEVLFRWPRKN